MAEVPEFSGLEPGDLADVAEVWPVESSTDLYRDDWVMALRADWIRRPGHPDEEPFRRLVLEHPGAVVVLAVDDEDRVLCVRQYRHPARRRFVELPAGLCDDADEEPEQVARRELAEEGGYRAGSWTHLGSTFSSPGISSELIHFYLARGLTPLGEDDAEFVAEHEEADMERLWVPFLRLYGAVVSNHVTDAPLVSAVLLAQAQGLVGSRL
jgi:8-oxo-dGTP pyrophosphatase MutT (NUDIX family)